MLNRRGFFGLMGSAAIAGPDAVKKAGSLTLADTGIIDKIATGAGVLDNIAVPADPVGGSMASYATQQLAARMLRSKEQIRFEKMDMYVAGIDPNVATLRSVALHHKITMTREIDWKRKEERKENYFHGVIKGWFR